jgi:pyruvate, water dikinase
LGLDVTRHDRRRCDMEGSNGERVKVWDATPGFEFIQEVDVPEMHSWFLDGTHSIPPWTPLYGWYWVNYCPHGTKAICEKLSTPTCKGWEMRYKDGGSYNAFHIVRDRKEQEERAVRFRQALVPYLEDFDGVWAKGKEELLSIYGKLKELDVDKASNLELFHHHYDLMMAYMRMWEIHHEGLFSSHSAYLLLTDLCQKRFGMSDQDPEFQNMLRGFSNKVYDMDKDLWDFGRLAGSMGLENIFKENEPQTIIAKLQESAKGKDWYAKFMKYLQTDEVGGWRMRRANDFTEPYWLEDPATPIGVVKAFISRGEDYELAATRADLAKQREKSVAAFLRKVPPDEKGFFESLVRLSGKISAFSEEHDLYCELMVQALMRRGYLGMGRRLAERGTIDRPEDIFMLNLHEIDRVMMVPESYDMRWITRRRRAEWTQWQTRPNPPLITDRNSFEEAVVNDLLASGDPIAIKVVVGEPPSTKPELEADLCGLCGCPGEVEGVARVAINYEDLKYVQPGEILVCPNTNPAWTPVFGIVKGVIADSGGTLAHTAIIGREYDVPTIVNTREGTAKIRTGQRIRMNAKDGAVHILDK